jgi:hypothetical protein
MYNGIQTCVTNNGFSSEFFKPTRGIRQGCPISANIFVVIAEFMASAIKANPRISGILINGTEFKISQYADDTCMYLSDEESLREAMSVLDLFRTCSGLKINRDKSEAIWIGASSNFRHRPCGLKWTRDSVKSLGIYINNDYQTMVNQNFNEKLDKVESIFNLWCLRNITLKGKVVVVNNLAVSQMLYVGTVIEPPKWAITKFRDLSKQFIWNKKPPKVKYSCLISSIAEGGLKLQDIDSKIKSLKVKWIEKIIDKEFNAPWKAYLSSFFNEEICKLPYCNLENKDYPVIKDEFYKSMLSTWSELHFQNPNSKTAPMA